MKDKDALARAGVAALTFAAFWPVAGFPFLDLDDDLYVTGNAVVRQGATWPGLKWAFTTFHAGNYYPLALASHMLDVSLFGPRAGAHHLVSLALHAASALLLFSALRAATGDRWRSAAVAAVFAVHPLQVESVAWIAERKNVLCGFFALLALRAYVSYAKRREPRFYAAATLALACALLSKPAAVALPAALLLFDFWPLARDGKEPASRLLLEKLPWFFLSGLSCLVTIAAARPAGAIVDVPAGARLANASLSLARYLERFVWPSGLASFYPHPGASVSSLGAALCAAGLATILAWSFLEAKRRPWLIVGFAWFFAFLLPTLGLVQVGHQAMADRYAYLALIGPALALAWSFPKKLEKSGPALLGACAALVALLLATTLQLRYWGDSLALARRAVDAGGESAFSCTNLAYELLLAGRVDEGAAQARAALAFDADDPRALNDLGHALILQKKYGEAVAALERALKNAPADDAVLLNLARARAGLQEERRR